MFKNFLIRTIFIFTIFIILFIIFFKTRQFNLTSRPNIIFITLDSLRADHLGCYNYKRNTSNNIDLLSTKGVKFTQAITQATWTTSSISSLITSFYPNHELIEQGYISKHQPNLIRILKNNGYSTILFSGNSIISMTFEDIKTDFDIFNVTQNKADKILQLAVDWIEKIRKTPFFLWVYFEEPHYPYTPPSDYYNNFINDNLYVHKNVPILEDDGIHNEYYSFRVIPRCVAEHGITDIGYYIAKYDGQIKFADEQIGKLLDLLHKKNIENNTLIILFSDHGELLGEHNFYFNHSHYVYEGLIRVPLLIIFPRRIPRNKIIQRTVQLIDIYPTVLDIVGIKNNRNIEGKSFLPLIMGKSDHHIFYTFSETAFWPSPRCIRTDEWKLIYNRKRENYELYNLKEDPKETNNLINERSDIANSLKQQLERWSQNAKTNLLYKKDNLSENEKLKLKSLGYIQ
jgi:arylsulfatase A-like enzyme